MAKQRKQELINELAQARSRATTSREGLNEGMHVGEKIRGNLARHRGVWLGGALLLGLIIAKLPARTKTVPSIKVKTKGAKADEELKTLGKAGIGLTLFKMIFDLGKPFLMSYLTRQIRRRF